MTDGPDPDSPGHRSLTSDEFAELTKRIMEQLSPDISKLLDDQFEEAKRQILDVLAANGGTAPDRVRDQIREVLKPHTGMLQGVNQVLVGDIRVTTFDWGSRHALRGEGTLGVHGHVTATGTVSDGVTDQPEPHVEDGPTPDRVTPDEVLRHAGTFADLYAVYQLLSDDDPRTVVLRAMMIAILLGLLVALHGKRSG